MRCCYTAELFSCAREDIPYLLAEVERLTTLSELDQIAYKQLSQLYETDVGEMTARAEKAEAERNKANKCIYDAETYFNLGANKFAYRTIKQYTHDATKLPPEGE